MTEQSVRAISLHPVFPPLNKCLHNDEIQESLLLAHWEEDISHPFLSQFFKLENIAYSKLCLELTLLGGFEVTEAVANRLLGLK